jgi:hypothetical protein
MGLKDIVPLVGLIGLTTTAVIGISTNCGKQIDKYYPLMAQSLVEAKESFRQGDYEKLKEIGKKAEDLRFRLDAEGGEWYYLLSSKGIKIYSMYKDIRDLERIAPNLS